MENLKIRIKYNAKPNVPNKFCHRFPIQELTVVRTRLFDIEDRDKAWQFLVECTSPITKLKQILFAFPFKRSKAILNAMDEEIINEKGNWIDVEEEQHNEMIELKYALNLS